MTLVIAGASAASTAPHFLPAADGAVDKHAVDLTPMDPSTKQYERWKSALTLTGRRFTCVRCVELPTNKPDHPQPDCLFRRS